ncbi:MAG: hypothetical protein JW720_03855 [Sedimentisphaerales bacterium]|nr:hypothetical protein [Sedimentisphaerales bacterium]
MWKMSGKFKILPAVLLMLAVVSSASAKLIHVDADYHPPGTDISDAFAGVKMETYYDYGTVVGGVYSRRAFDPVLASTGTNVFGHAVTGADMYGRPLNETWVFPQTMLVVQFYDPADWVALDIVGDNLDGSGDRAGVDVYDADLNLIEWAETPIMDYAEFARINISRDSFDIAFVVVSGANGAVYIDNLQANVVPEPVTFLLFGLGGLFLRKGGGVRRQA